jgi:pyrroline-5-carboxylate reductase
VSSAFEIASTIREEVVELIGIIGAGGMACALAVGWGEPVLACDAGSGRADRLVEELGGEVVRDASELVSRADTILLAHPPHVLGEVANSVDASGKLVISVLAATTVDALKRAYPGATVVRAMPNLPVEIRCGVTCIAEGGEAAAELFERVGLVLVVPETQMDLATATMGVMPAYVAVFAEAAIDASVCHGLPVARAREMVLATVKGTADLLITRNGDTLAVRREVASPGEATVRGLAALERCGLRNALAEAANCVMERLRLPYGPPPAPSEPGRPRPADLSRQP